MFGVRGTVSSPFPSTHRVKELIAKANNEGSGESAQLRRLASAFAYLRKTQRLGVDEDTE